MTKLTQHQIKELLTYEPDTGDFRWKSGRLAGSMNWAGYRVIKIYGRIHRAHRLAWIAVHGEDAAGEIDHINGDRGDNRMANLRLATKAQNGENRRAAQANNRTGLLGACWHKKAGKYYAQIEVAGKKTYLGLFDSAQEAHMAYLNAKREMHAFCTI